MAFGAKKAFDTPTHDKDRYRWINLPYLGCDCCPAAGEEWVRKQLLRASVVIPPTAGLALEMMVRGIQTKSQVPERTVVVPSSYPALDQLAGTPARASIFHSPEPGKRHIESKLSVRPTLPRPPI
jgi:hypothetical protein